MATLAENLKTFLLADTTVKQLVGSRVHYNHVPQGKGYPFIFYQQSGSSDDAALDDSPGAPFRLRFTVECIDTDLARCRTLVNRVQAITNKHRGTVGAQTVQAIFAAEQDDEYVPRGIGSDDGEHVAALSLEVIQ